MEARHTHNVTWHANRFRLVYRGVPVLTAFTVLVTLVVLLLSNLWLLKEVDRLRRRIDVYQREVINLDQRMCRLIVELEEGQICRSPGLPKIERIRG